jgi:hypothetical protein
LTNVPERLAIALGAMGTGGPRNLVAYLEQPGPDFEKADAKEVEAIVELMLSSDPNHPARLRFSNAIRSWDNIKEAKWTNGTARNTAVRRNLIHGLLRSDTPLARRIDDLLPFYRLDEPLIIAAEHRDWYEPTPGVRDYYWQTYVAYLQERRGWEPDSVLNMDNTTRAIVECLADPESSKSYASRGLVMGYVQSGKTANFIGVVARAADAGYRLMIVLAGTWNILRNQTQRRFDKDLLGKELLKNDAAYALHQPPDWDEFLEHGTDPAELGHYAWQRLTRPDIDFRRLNAAIDNLEFEKREKALPIYHPGNLHSLPVKLLVVKKHSGILDSLVKDLKLIRTNLTDLPTLVIDDESDQAGLNTVDPRRPAKPGAERSKTNLRIVELLELFPRAQYVGYTATPYANALVDPDDAEDLFPRDFIVSLDRPRGYMGVSDFFDPASNYHDLQQDDFTLAEIAYIRRVKNAIGEDNEDLKKALRSYVLSGALKLYRLSREPHRYKPAHFRHHTMLIHTSSSTGEQAFLAERLSELWIQCAFNSAKGLSELEGLWKDDFAKVCAAQGKEIVPKSFEELIPHLSEAIKRIEKGARVFLVVNSDKAEAPDFSAAPVWKIVVGGNKLSRGYTIEGLTVSYYRRVSGTADTLMQMGRWFGFRPGYQDLVRVFLGVQEGKKRTTDLVALFKEVCRMEERFREEIKRYVRTPGAKRITPREIPPMIAVSGSLPPTAGNKMFNAQLASKNFGGRWSMLTLAPKRPGTMDKNVETLNVLLTSSTERGLNVLGGVTSKQKTITAETFVFEATNAQLVAFLKAYRWLEDDYKYPEQPTDASLQIEFLEQQKHGITSWLIMAPQRKISFGNAEKVGKSVKLAVKKRQRDEGRGFQVFGEPDHRKIAEFLAGIEPEPGKSKLTSPSRVTGSLQNSHRGVCLLYLVREEPHDKVSIGFELLFPNNQLPFDTNFTVRRKSESLRIVVADNEDAKPTQ